LLDIDAVSRASDRFLYWPLIGVCALSARAVTRMFRERVWIRRALMGLAAGVTVLCVLATAIHVNHFRTDYTLWAHEYEVDQENTEALWALAGIAKYEGLVDSAHQLCAEGFQAADRKRYQWTAIRFALCQLETSLDLATPDDLETVVYVRGVYDELMEKSLLSADRGSLRFDMLITSETIRDRLMADPNSVALPRARAHLASGNVDQAIEQLEQITRSYPAAKEGWRMLIAAYQAKGKDDRATATADHAKRLFGEELSE
jgi:tetratricopeptide (TPR) repeat protein